MTEFSPLTREITASLPKNVKKEQGIFITPRTIIAKLYESLRPMLREDARMLEPSSGTGEIVRYFAERHPGLRIDAVEKNATIFRRVVESGMFRDTPGVRLISGDYLAYVPDTPYHLIVGNPPYVVVDKTSVPLQYADYVVGRPNLFGLFVVHAVSMLAEDGVLAMIIPKSFLNAAYYAKIRNYLKTAGKIIQIVDFEKDGGFIDTQQSTIGFVWQKTADTAPCLLTDTTVVELPVPLDECPYSLQFGDNYVFSDNAAYLRDLLRGSTTLKSLGLAVKTGNIVWNQRKAQLTDDANKTLLLYNSNIAKHNEISLMEFANDEKKQYIDLPGVNDTVIVVNRGNGNAAYRLSYARVDGTRPYLAENHLNVIYWVLPDKTNKKTVFDQVLRSFANPKTELFIRAFLGNNGLSKTELETVFPIFI